MAYPCFITSGHSAEDSVVGSDLMDEGSAGGMITICLVADASCWLRPYLEHCTTGFSTSPVFCLFKPLTVWIMLIHIKEGNPLH